MKNTSTLTVTPIQDHYQVALREIPTGYFCLYRGHLCIVGYESLIYVGEDASELMVDHDDFEWDDPCIPVDAELSYSVVTG